MKLHLTSMPSSKAAQTERLFLSCLRSFDRNSSTFCIVQSAPLSSVTYLSHFDLTIFAFVRGFVALALVPPGTAPESLLMQLQTDPTLPMFHMPSILVWFGLVDMFVRQVHIARRIAVDSQSMLCWYYCAATDMPSNPAWFGGSIGVNVQI
jgi:hypothetical protein